jgi:hypothetical protein
MSNEEFFGDENMDSHSDHHDQGKLRNLAKNAT